MVNTKPLYKISEAYNYLEQSISKDSLYLIAKTELVPVVRCGRGPYLFPRSSLDLIASGEVDLSTIVSRRQTTRNRL
jgi:hypothetical protein